MRRIARRSQSHPSVWADVRALRVEPNEGGYFDVYGPGPDAEDHHRVSTTGVCDCPRRFRCSHLDAVNVFAERVLEGIKERAKGAKA